MSTYRIAMAADASWCCPSRSSSFSVSRWGMVCGHGGGQRPRKRSKRARRHPRTPSQEKRGIATSIAFPCARRGIGPRFVRGPEGDVLHFSVHGKEAMRMEFAVQIRTHDRLKAIDGIGSRLVRAREVDWNGVQRSVWFVTGKFTGFHVR